MEDGYYEVDLAGKFTFFNEAMRGVLGFSADELMGMSDLEYTSPETAKKIYKTFNKTYRTGIPANLEDYEVIRRDGSIRTIEFKAALMRDEKDQPAGFRGVVRDVTKRKKMENELERRFQYLEGVLEAAPYAIIALDHHHQVVKWNPGAEKLFGYSQEEVIGKELDSLVATTPDAMEEARRATKTTMGGEALLSWETVRFRKNGSPVDVIAAGSPIMVDGGLIGVVAMYDDITDRKKAEKAFRDSEKKYRALSETATDMTYTLDLNGNLTYVSPVVERLTGFSWQDFLGRHFTEVIAPEYVNLMVERFKEGLAGKEFPLVEIEMKHKNGGTVPIELNVSSLLDATGKATGRIGVARDITDRKRATERAQPLQ
ncbi:MAG: PAS domain-containing protein [Deltaproteobacteria bacterium]|nr:PAS domain-containing protein [Deltaproteobacteria bacterium]